MHNRRSHHGAILGGFSGFLERILAPPVHGVLNPAATGTTGKDGNMFHPLKKVVVAVAAMAALALGGSAIAGAASSSTTSTTTAAASTTSGRPAFSGPAHGTAAHENAEKGVTGSAASKAQAAAVKSVGSGTAGAVTSDFTGSGFETTVTTANGTKTEVHLDSSYNVVDGPGGHGGPPAG